MVRVVRVVWLVLQVRLARLVRLVRLMRVVRLVRLVRLVWSVRWGPPLHRAAAAGVATKNTGPLRSERSTRAACETVQLGQTTC